LEKSHRDCEIASREEMAYLQKQLKEAPGEGRLPVNKGGMESRNKFKEKSDAKYGFRR
jgi:hypothetical protein